MRVNRTLLYAGVFLVAIGGVVVTADLGIVDEGILRDALGLWPLAVIALGLGLVLRRTQVSLSGGLLAAAVPGLLLGSAFAVAPDVGTFCGSAGVATPAAIQRGTFEGPASVSVTLDCGSLDLTTVPGADWELQARERDARAPVVDASARSLSIVSIGHDGWPGAGRDDWKLTLPESDVERLAIVVNAGRGDVSLGEAQLDGLSVTANAGDVRVDASTASIADLTGMVNLGRLSILLPDGDVAGSLQVGAGSIQVCAPPELGLFIKSGDTIGDIKVDGRRVDPTNSYQSSNYHTAEHRADLEIRADFGAIEINPIGGCR